MTDGELVGLLNTYYAQRDAIKKVWEHPVDSSDDMLARAILKRVFLLMPPAAARDQALQLTVVVMGLDSLIGDLSALRGFIASYLVHSRNAAILEARESERRD